MNVDVRDALNGYAKVTRSVGVLVKLLDAVDDNTPIAPGEFADLMDMIHASLKQQDALAERLTA